MKEREKVVLKILLEKILMEFDLVYVGYKMKSAFSHLLDSRLNIVFIVSIILASWQPATFSK